MNGTSLYAIPTQEFENLVNEIRELKIFLRDFRLTNTTPELPRKGDINLAVKVLGRGKSWIYKQTSKNAKNPVPHTTFNGKLLFETDKLKKYLADNTADPWQKEIQVNNAISESAKKKIDQQFKRTK